MVVLIVVVREREKDIDADSLADGERDAEGESVKIRLELDDAENDFCIDSVADAADDWVLDKESSLVQLLVGVNEWTSEADELTLTVKSNVWDEDIERAELNDDDCVHERVSDRERDRLSELLCVGDPDSDALAVLDGDREGDTLIEVLGA